MLLPRVTKPPDVTQQGPTLSLLALCLLFCPQFDFSPPPNKVEVLLLKNAEAIYGPQLVGW